MNRAPLGGLLVVDKPAGLTSHDVVGRVRRLVSSRRVGHAGTLDPLATGVLVLGVNRGTKLLTYLVGADKSYSATVRLGAATTTDDAEGEMISTSDAGSLSASQIEHALNGSRGHIMQVPSTISAIKVKGQPAYKRARAGENIELAPRPVEVSKIEMVGGPRVADQFLDVDIAVNCSSGTYIRAIARDLGNELGVGGHLTKLRRTRVGRWTTEDATSLDELEGNLANIPIISVDEVCRTMFASVTISGEAAQKFSHGQPPPPSILGGSDTLGDGEMVALVTDNADGVSVAGLARWSDGRFRTEFVANPA